jgi:hypothetical protein
VWRPTRLMGTGDLDRLSPAVFEALKRHMKSLGTIGPHAPEPLGMKSATCRACSRTQRALGTIQMEKAAWGVSGKIFGVAAARADPNGRR